LRETVENRFYIPFRPLSFNLKPPFPRFTLPGWSTIADSAGLLGGSRRRITLAGFGAVFLWLALAPVLRSTAQTATASRGLHTPGQCPRNDRPKGKPAFNTATFF